MSSPAELAKTLVARANALKAEATALGNEAAALATVLAPTPIIGVNLGTFNEAWLKTAAPKLIAAGIKSARIEMGRDSIQKSVAAGFSGDLAVVGNPSNGTPLSKIDQAAWVASTVAQVKECATAGVTLLEVGNEMYGKGGWPNHEGAVYGRLLLALAEACKGLPVKLLANLYPSKNGAEWLEPMLTAAPGLKTLLAGFTAHTYGLVGWDYGEGGMRYQLALARQLGVQNTGVYVTEYGVECEGDSPYPGFTAANPTAHAQQIKEMYAALTSNPDVHGIWHYGSRDEQPATTGLWGLFNYQGAARPALAVVSSYVH